MNLPEVLHTLVNQLPADWDLGAAHEAIDDHFAQKSDKPTHESKPAPPASIKGAKD